MGLWNERVLPRLTERTLSSAEVSSLRAVACAGLHGDVLEIGFGSGLNLRHYPRAVVSVSAVEPSEEGWRLSQQRREASRLTVTRTGLDGQSLAAADASYDCVLTTFTLCTIPDAAAALAEVRRVLRPGGTFHFVEHGLAPDERVVVWQHRLEPLQRRVFAGCHLTRDVPGLVTAAGLELRLLEAGYHPGPTISRPWTYVHVGVAQLMP